METNIKLEEFVSSRGAVTKRARGNANSCAASPRHGASAHPENFTKTLRKREFSGLSNYSDGGKLSPVPRTSGAPGFFFSLEYAIDAMLFPLQILRPKKIKLDPKLKFLEKRLPFMHIEFCHLNRVLRNNRMWDSE